jgi:hypothetical protein
MAGQLGALFLLNVSIIIFFKSELFVIHLGVLNLYTCLYSVVVFIVISYVVGKRFRVEAGQ